MLRREYEERFYKLKKEVMNLKECILDVHDSIDEFLEFLNEAGSEDDVKVLEDAQYDLKHLQDEKVGYLNSLWSDLNDRLYTRLPNFCKSKVLDIELCPYTVGSIVNVNLKECTNIHNAPYPDDLTPCFLRTDGAGLLYAVPVASITRYCPKGVSFIIPSYKWDSAISDVPYNTVKNLEEAIKLIDEGALNALMGLEE